MVMLLFIRSGQKMIDNVVLSQLFYMILNIGIVIVRI